MKPSPRRIILVAAWLAAGVAAAPGAVPAKIGYNEHIQPILAENCFHCHGPDSATRKAKLRLDRAEFAIKPRAGGDLEAAIVPGQPAVSPLIERIKTTDPEEVMPPPEVHKRLQPEEIALLERWVAEGAEYQEHWSLLAPVRPPVPQSPPAAGWARTPVDQFVAARLAEAGLRPSPEEAPARLLRRLAFDLTGLPPAPADLAAFVREPSPRAYEQAVDRMLASDAAAEHFARHWLDAVRYADTHGIHIDNYRSIWPYRDWVIGAFRRNLPFDQFTIEQMAGDLLPGATLDQQVASGYNRCLPTTSEGGAIAAEYEAIYAKDRVDTMSTVWLGLTTGCASCHDHKFDPVTMKDFYSLAAFFRHNTMPAMDGNVSDTRPSLFVPAAGDRERWPVLQAEIAAARAGMQTRAGAADGDFASWLAAGAALAAPPVDRRVSLHLPLAENTAEDSVPGRGTAPAPAAESARVRGPYGPAVRLDGADRVAGPAVPMRREGAVSVALLVRVDGQPSGTLVSCLDADDRQSGWELLLEEGRVGLYFADRTGGVTARGVARTALTPGKWHHVLLSYDAASMRSRSIDVFVDGRPAANSGETSNFPHDIVPAAPLRLGARQAAGGRPGPGLAGGQAWVQDLRVFNRGFGAGEARDFAAVLDAHAARAVPAEKRTAAHRKALRSHFLATADAASLGLAAGLDRLLAEEDGMRQRGGVSLVMEEKADGEPFAQILNRGDYTQPGERVGADVPAVLPPLPAGAPRNRLGLARWLVAPENPLTARVTVNRAWQQIFGTGLVESAGDFGVTGSRPSHPELLDWLAVEFRESGWDFRRLVRLLVTSATYRQSAAVSPALLERDPDNRLLARGPRHRLDAEQLRDLALAASDLLVAKLGGRPVRPYQPEGIWEEVAMKQSTTRFYRPDSGPNLYRRSVYTLWKRTAPPPAMDILNAPSREVSCVRRDRTNTPLQALVTLNDPLFIEASRHLATRVLRAARTWDARLDALTLRLLGRALAPAERGVVRRTHAAALSTYRQDPAAAAKLLAVGDSPVDASLPAAELAAWTIVASQILNLDESLTK
jgi:mono/diheme cytochrome c family protein/cytochrome c553